jgi:hypothetical protein
MIRLASVIDTFEAPFLAQYGQHLLPSQRQALAAIKHCRSAMSPRMQAQCPDCEKQVFVPHSCGHRHCPHCQAHESQQWLQRQLNKQVPGAYFLLTFTLPAELRPLAWQHQRIVYDLLLRCAWQTVNTFSHNDSQRKGSAGAVAALHTHSRRLGFHPHVHLVMPAGAIDAKQRLWRVKRRKKESGYLFNHKALAKVFRAKMIAALNEAGLALPAHYPKEWVADCKHVGSGEKALIYLGRYLYRGVIREQDILACDEEQVTFRYRDSKTGQLERKTVTGVEFLRLVLQHVLPKGFRRAREFGFLHANSKRLIALIQLLHRIVPKPLPPRPPLLCPCCGNEMKIVRTRIAPPILLPGRPPSGSAQAM